jgi:hypothetical protein
MLQRMCHGVLSKVELKAIVKSRGLPAAAVDPGILTGLFLTEQGLADAFRSLGREELAALYMLKAVAKPVGISFFETLYPSKPGNYLTPTQKYQGVLAKVKDRLVRSGVLLMCDVRSVLNEAKIELWRFALPVQFHAHLPPLLESPRTFDGPGEFHTGVVRGQLLADLAGAAPAPATEKESRVPAFRLIDGELLLGESRFQTKQLAGLQLALWTRQLGEQKNKKANRREYLLDPPAAVNQLLGTLAENQWVAPDELDQLTKVFTAQQVDCAAVCEAGWQAGMLAKRGADGKTWYRPAPAEQSLPPHQYLDVVDQGQFTSVNLSLIPMSALELLAQLGNLRTHPSDSRQLTITPNLVRMGRASDEVLGSEQAAWLFHNSPAFQQAHDMLHRRRGKTVLHSDILIARVTDLSLKVALEKLLGENCASLKNEYVAFPRGALSDVQRLVRKSGHVIKEVIDHAS